MYQSRFVIDDEVNIALNIKQVLSLPSGTSPIVLDLAIQLPGPPYPEHAPRQIRNLTVDVMSADVHVGVPENTAYFHTFALSTANGSITVDVSYLEFLWGRRILTESQRIQADHISLKASGQPLIARLRSGSSVSLFNTDAPILANVSMVYEDRHPNSSVVRISSHSAINASVSLSNMATRHPPALDLVATSLSSDPCDVQIITAPSDALISACISSNGPALLSLPPAFEGEFFLRAPRTGLRHLHTRCEAADPSGRGRNRTEWHRQDNDCTIGGRTCWGEESDTGQTGFANVSGASASLCF